MNLIDFCKYPPNEVVAANSILNYTNLDFSIDVWPQKNFSGNDSIYNDITILKHICDNIIDIHVTPQNSTYCLLSKAGDYYNTLDDSKYKLCIEYVINSGYYLYLFKRPRLLYNGALLDSYVDKYKNHQKYVKDLVLDNNNYYPKNIIKYNDKLILLLWILKYQNILPKVLINHTITPFVYT